jgi:hypothetical protein
MLVTDDVSHPDTSPLNVGAAKNISLKAEGQACAGDGAVRHRPETEGPTKRKKEK